jgi:hypothetical protein
MYNVRFYPYVGAFVGSEDFSTVGESMCIEWEYIGDW